MTSWICRILVSPIIRNLELGSTHYQFFVMGGFLYLHRGQRGQGWRLFTDSTQIKLWNGRKGYRTKSLFVSFAKTICKEVLM